VDDQKDAARAARLSPNGKEQACRDIIVIGGSAGALAAILDIAGGFPRDFAGSIFIVSHVGANRSRLPELLANAAQMPSAHAENGEPIRPGRIYAALPDRHMMIEGGHIRLSRGPRQHFTRPAINPLFRSAAASRSSRIRGTRSIPKCRKARPWRYSPIISQVGTNCRVCCVAYARRRSRREPRPRPAKGTRTWTNWSGRSH
jgi:hypothetical protein